MGIGLLMSDRSDTESSGNTRVRAYSEAEQRIAAALVEEHYETLTRIARGRRRRAGVGATMNTGDLVHESFARLNGRADFTSSEHFLRATMLAMRHVIIDYARRKLAERNGGGMHRVPFDEADSFFPEFGESPEDLVGIARLLESLEAENPRWLRVVDARYFSGMTEAETAMALGMSERTVRRDWRDARDWLAARVGA